MSTAAYESLKRMQRRQAKNRYYGRRCSTRAKKTEAKRQAQDDLGWLCVCGAWVEDIMHCPNCRADSPPGCPCSFCQDPDPDDGGDDEFYDPQDESQEGGADA